MNPVVEGRVRAKQRLHNDTERITGIPVLIHGDAAFSGQGVVMETLNLSNLAGYCTGGTIHLIVNNQIGFTTNPRDSRSTEYCTDIAKFIQAPIFHVNGEDPEACVFAAELALEFRQTFKRDVVLDLVCYRKWGHNEGDEPAFTQPLEYKRIRGRDPISKVFSRNSGGRAVRVHCEEITAAIEREFEEKLSQAIRDADAAAAEYRAELDRAHKAVKDGASRRRGMQGFTGPVEGARSTLLARAGRDRRGRSRYSIASPTRSARSPKASRRTRSCCRSWRSAATTSAAACPSTGAPPRHSPTARSCWKAHRSGSAARTHAAARSPIATRSSSTSTPGEPYFPLANLDPKQAPFEVYDSSLSEAAVLGFEFGYALDDPASLVMWEAQFGDFTNGAQVVIDQFITSCESKWNRSNGLVLLLPHAYEGQGPEHSSARLERFLQMCAENNIQVAYPTTPAQMFHLLRRQVKRTFRKPLVVMTPKSLLRLPAATSPMEEFATGRFREIIDDDAANPDDVTRVLICSGKVYYDLMEKRKKLEYEDRGGDPHGTVLPVARETTQGRDLTLQASAGMGLGSGRIAEHGRLAVRRTAVAGRWDSRSSTSAATRVPAPRPAPITCTNTSSKNWSRRHSTSRVPISVPSRAG